ncbi:hypothetical protein HanPSC8_Chr10g0421501 [Helianthus annuus]|nr:hypothetical protein HanPSC8_Chr10g0421501 [Helianthus annuus]
MSLIAYSIDRHSFDSCFICLKSVITCSMLAALIEHAQGFEQAPHLKSIFIRLSFSDVPTSLAALLLFLRESIYLLYNE